MNVIVDGFVERIEQISEMAVRFKDASGVTPIIALVNPLDWHGINRALGAQTKLCPWGIWMTMATPVGQLDIVGDDTVAQGSARLLSKCIGGIATTPPART